MCIKATTQFASFKLLIKIFFTAWLCKNKNSVQHKQDDQYHLKNEMTGKCSLHVFNSVARQRANAGQK